MEEVFRPTNRSSRFTANECLKIIFYLHLFILSGNDKNRCVIQLYAISCLYGISKRVSYYFFYFVLIFNEIFINQFLTKKF